MGLLSLVMFVWMSLTRLPAMRRAGLTLADAAHTEDLRPRLDPAGRKAGDNYNHLFEAPTVFYAVALVIAFAGLADPPFAWAAWTFLAARVAHSLVQATVNKVPLRLTCYLVSWTAVGVMIVRGLLKL
ncbi:MAG: MAPEG family protein [Caulobacterales bacterium]|nr:MAPEG family protein [Caulobacterales bacterium]